ncbi:predicted protein [Naegleria gruberi]|uniref:Predicted protein n=1 Tax=Naegleria gruberi TaxID=5762 RepID=D2V8C3_NAEGR|nr:uncharacterized protein NAEGRDRAFT_47482 [Naegleria gruberi]EFC47017.1 predicted protein [Naegleria gruberi]|eukprot:XP_002679761.1 predicted protein [Naegleria gruberi strain NEG-M]
MLNQQDCILPQETTNCFSRELFSILSTSDHNEILNICMNNVDPSLTCVSNNTFPLLFENQTTQQLSPVNNNNNMTNNASSVALSPSLNCTSAMIEQTNISHSSDTHSSPNPSTNFQTTATSSNICSVESSPLLKLLQQSSVSPSSSQPSMFGQVNNQIVDSSSMYTNSITESCYQLIDEALKDTQSSLGLIWSKFDSNNTTSNSKGICTTSNVSNRTAVSTSTLEQIYQQQQPIASFVACVSNQSSHNNGMDIFPFNLDSNAINMLTSEKKKNLKRKQSTIESNLPTKKQTITYEILPMSQTAIPRPSPIQHQSSFNNRITTTDRRRKYKVRFGPNMFDEISIKKNNDKLSEVVADARK